MLVLRRKAGEAIVLNGTITIHVLAVEGERVKLGISAPPEVVIVRSELLEVSEQVTSPPVVVPAAAAQSPHDSPLPYAEAETAPTLVPSPAPAARASYAGPNRSGSRNRREPAAARPARPSSMRYR